MRATANSQAKPNVTDEERAELLKRRPINWTELGSLGYRRGEERQLRSIRKGASRD